MLGREAAIIPCDSCAAAKSLLKAYDAQLHDKFRNSHIQVVFFDPIEQRITRDYVVCRKCQGLGFDPGPWQMFPYGPLTAGIQFRLN